VRGLLWVILLALAWVAVNGDFHETTFLAGMVLAILILVFVRATAVDYLRKLVLVVAFVAFFLWELVLANMRVARDVLSPRPRISPGVIAIPLDIRTPAEVTLLANLITLTPGTLSLDVAGDRTMLYIHGMYVSNADEVRRSIKSGFESRIKELFE
jgi:multicomponent Na+:H+ antiporter subunit E